MKFVSLETPSDEASFEEALSRGIPADGSLYVPKHIPTLDAEVLHNLPDMTTAERGKALLAPWVNDELSDSELNEIVAMAATFDTPVVAVGDKHVLELFHGPTMAFKDVAARYLAAFMSHFNKKSGRTSTVLVATSGDTGGAIAHGFGGIPGVRVVVLYPKCRVSRLQQEQLRRTADNIHTLEVSGDFDDCQQLVKEAFKDAQLTKRLHLTSANSISIGRLLPQTTYYAAAYGQLNQPNIRMVVPTGNIGNLTAGVLAQRMGVPIARFLAANNANNALYRLAQTGTYEPLRTKQTASNAMDVGAPNNLPRLMRLFDDSVDELRKNMDVSYVNDADTAKTISSVYEQTGYLLDPHTAVAWRASENVPSNGMADVIVSTASPLKFAEEIEKLTGIVVDNSAELEKLLSTAESYSSIEATMDDFATFLEELN